MEVVGQAIQALSQDDWHAALRRVLDSLGAPLSHIGIHVLCLLLHASARAGITSRLQLQTWFARAPQLSPIMRGDLLPLPLGLSVEDVAEATEYFSGISAIKLTDQELS